ncbi:MAG: PhoH family protein [Prochlorothrix sp.]
MQKFFVLDTNVLLHEPNALLHFEDNHVVLPITVIEELDRFKRKMEETGRNARNVSRQLDALRKRGRLTESIPLDRGGSLRVALCSKETLRQLPLELEGDVADNAILAVALELKRNCNCPVTLVSKDSNLRIKADVLGITAEDFESAQVDLQDLYQGIDDHVVPPEVITQLFQSGEADLDRAFPPNHALMLVDTTNPNHTALGVVGPNGHRVRLATKIPASGISRVQPRNREQRLALDLLLQDNIRLVTLVGKAGTGKTLLAIAAGLQKVADEQLYSRLLIARPIIPMGRDLGYLPGDVKEKLTPWMQPLYDNLDLILGTQEKDHRTQNHNNNKAWRHGYEELIDRGLLHIEPLTYIRGRSIPQQYFIVDEAQNLTPHEVKTILTRAGEGTKVVLTGDPDQIDNPYIDAASNGLTYVVERFKDEPLAAHITLQRGERSDLAERATELL